MARLQHWISSYESITEFRRDADGRKPCHTYFYPEEEYNVAILELLAEHCKRGYGEVEVHLHHDHDTSDQLRLKLAGFSAALWRNHGVLSWQNGMPRYGFVHGNWALDNSRKDGRWCGVNDELIILSQTGCYADFTLPAAHSDTQTSTVNSIYYAKDDPLAAKSHDKGIAVSVNGAESGDLMIFQGPLGLNWQQRKLFIWPRIEAADIAEANPSMPIARRVDIWVDQHIHVKGRPDWIFVKLSTHGCQEEFSESMFAGELSQMFDALETRYNDGTSYVLHYASTREAYNIVKAAEAGLCGNPDAFRNYKLPPPDRNTGKWQGPVGPTYRPIGKREFA